MNKLAQFVDYYRNLGRQAALADREKTAGFLPSSRMAKAGLGVAGVLGGIGAAKALSTPEPSTLENMYEGGKDMLSNMSQEELMGYASILGQLGQGSGYAMNYAAGTPSPSDYSLQDLGQLDQEYASYDPSSMMGYSYQMTPEEAYQYMAFNAGYA